MRIVNITEDEILFDNGNRITYHHVRDCSECNWADFLYLETQMDILKTMDFTEDLVFEFVDGFGFRFKSNNHSDYYDYWIVVPCYSDQNSYYSSDIDIYYCDKPVNKTLYNRSDPWNRPIVSGECAHHFN